MNAGDPVWVWPEGRPEQKACALVAIVSRNGKAIAVGFEDPPPFRWGDGMAVHPVGRMMLFACRVDGEAQWSEAVGGEPFVIVPADEEPLA